MQITILTFGSITDITGSERFQLNDVSTTDEVVKQLEEKFPQLKTTRFAIAVNKQMISASTNLENNATLALLPPFSGG